MELTEGKRKEDYSRGGEGRAREVTWRERKHSLEKKMASRGIRRGKKAHIAAQMRGECISGQLQDALEEAGFYFTVVIPWAEPKKRTKWHPTDKTGPFSKLTRGAFASEAEAHKWAKKHLEGNPYEVKKKRK